MKQKWYAHKNGGVPYTLGEITSKEKCYRCGGFGRHAKGFVTVECNSCKGKGYIREVRL